MPKPKVKVGYMKCETRKCLNGDGGDGRVVLFENEHGTLSYRCDECGSSPYVKKGSGQYLAWQRDMTKTAAAPAPAADAKAPPKKDAPKPPPPAKPASSLLG